MDATASSPGPEPPPEPVRRLWEGVRRALAANGNPGPRRIDRLATTAGLELPATTVAGWFETWSVVPAWEKFEALVTALAAEHDEDWRALHAAALTADRKRKKANQRHRKVMRDVSPVSGAGPPAGSGRVPQQLPRNVVHFTGRMAELARLDALLSRDDATRPAAMMISVITGTAGVGKTALVVHWAHRIRDLFPDGQLFVNLRGYDPGPPMAPEQALEEFLRALQVPAERIPSGLEGRAGLYRSLLDGRRVLIVLDNANTAEQVRPLLPASPTCRVVVTSRSRLSGLIARDGASRVTLDLLPPMEGIALLRDVVGAERIAAEPEATAELAGRCAYLPLALRIAAERAVTHPHVTLADLAGELAVEQHRLDLLSTAEEEDETTAIRAVLSWSYRALSPDVARAFRLLGLHPGPHLSAPAAAALVDTDPAQVRRLLETLVSTHLIEETGKDRYRFHDLLRVYAAECATAQETDHDRAAAVRRTLLWYLHTGDAADRVLNPHRRRIPLDPPEAVCSPLEFTTYGQALDWCEAERVNLVAATHHAAESGELDIAWKIPLALWGFFTLRKHWADLIDTHQIGLAAAQRLHDRRGESWTWGALGFVYFDLRRYDEALEHYQRGLPICQEIGDQWGEAIALAGQGTAYFYLGKYEDSLDRSQRALLICQEINDPWSQTLALLNIGGVHRRLQQFDDALGYFRRALDAACSVRNRWGEAQTLRNIGVTYRDLGHFEDALDYFRRACAAYREISDPLGEARTLRNIGDILQKRNQMEAAADCWRRALPILEDLGDSVTATKLRASLSILDGHDPDQRA